MAKTKRAESASDAYVLDDERLPTDATYVVDPPVPTVELTGAHLIARSGPSVAVYEIVWESLHGQSRRTMTIRKCDEIPAALESVVYGLRRT